MRHVLMSGVDIFYRDIRHRKISFSKTRNIAELIIRKEDSPVAYVHE